MEHLRRFVGAFAHSTRVKLVKSSLISSRSVVWESDSASRCFCFVFPLQMAISVEGVEQAHAALFTALRKEEPDKERSYAWLKPTIECLLANGKRFAKFIVNGNVMLCRYRRVGRPCRCKCREDGEPAVFRRSPGVSATLGE